MPRPDNRVAFANTLRGIAVLCVLIAHFIIMFWSDNGAASALILVPQDVSTGGFLFGAGALFYPYLDWGHFGVALFFLVSGFVIPFSVEKLSAVGFLSTRFFRIFPLYWAGFSVSLLVLWIASRTHGTTWPYSPAETWLSYFPGFREMIVFAPRLDGISWTLSIEVKFYILCAAGSALFARRDGSVFAIPAALAAAILVVSWQMDHILSFSHFLWLRAQVLIAETPYLVFMFIGTAFHHRYAGYISRTDATAVTAFLVVTLLIVTSASWAQEPPVQVYWSYFWALALFLGVMKLPHLIPENSVTNFFADISYPLYVIHSVPGFGVMHFLMHRGTQPATALMIAFVASIALAFILHVLVESPSRVFGKRFAESLSLRASSMQA